MNKVKRSPIWIISRDDLQKLVESSKTIGQVLKYFELKNHGGNFKTLQKRFLQESIDYSKFSKNYGHWFKDPVPLENVLKENSSYSRSNLKKRLIKGNILENCCSICGQEPRWNGMNLVMVLDHINGKNDDNRLENLRLICPNCNSQTPTFAGRNAKVYKEKVKKTFSRRKVTWPSKEELNVLLWEKPTTHIANEYTVSDNAITKWAKYYGLKKPPRGYWSKNRYQLNEEAGGIPET